MSIHDCIISSMVHRQKHPGVTEGMLCVEATQMLTMLLAVGHLIICNVRCAHHNVGGLFCLQLVLQKEGNLPLIRSQKLLF